MNKIAKYIHALMPSPSAVIEKQTNEMPDEIKAKTITSKKRQQVKNEAKPTQSK